MAIDFEREIAKSFLGIKYKTIHRFLSVDVKNIRYSAEVCVVCNPDAVNPCSRLICYYERILL